MLEFSFANVTNAWGGGVDSATAASATSEKSNETISTSTASASTTSNDDSTKTSPLLLLLDELEDLSKVSTRVIVHGFGSSCSHVWIYEMRAALMAVVSIILGFTGARDDDL